jgi:tellurite resistance protein
MAEATSGEVSPSHFEYLPVALFGAVMGLTGLSVAWGIAQRRYGLGEWISDVVGVIAVLSFVAMAIAYAIKAATAPGKVMAEFEHPVAVNTFATGWVSLLLLPIILASVYLELARILWVIGAVGITLLALYIVGRWISRQHQTAHATPAWILPVVGMLDLPLAVPYLSLPHAEELMIIGFAVGTFFAIPLFTLIFARLVFDAPLPTALEPSLLILVAPFAVDTSTYLATTGQFDLFATSLYVLTIFTLIVLVARLRHLGSCCPFRVAWWAVSFPLAACAIAALKFAVAKPGWATDGIAIGLLTLATVVILWLLWRTLRGIAKGELRTLTS